MMVRMDLLGDRLVFQRDDGRGVIEGHFWVVESTLGHFEVQQPRLTITAFGGCETESVTAVDPGRTFGLWSNDFAGTGGPLGAHVGCSLVNDSTVECCHGTGTAPATVTMFLVEFDPAIGGSTEGGLETLAGTTATVPLANVPGAASMALLGRPGNFGSVPGGRSFGDDAEGFVTVSLTPNDTLEISRGDGGGSAYARWQVVHWPD
jgi:hypothetical protein